MNIIRSHSYRLTNLKLNPTDHFLFPSSSYTDLSLFVPNLLLCTTKCKYIMYLPSNYGVLLKLRKVFPSLYILKWRCHKMTSGCKWMYIKQKTLFAVLLNDNEVKGEKWCFFFFSRYNLVPTHNTIHCICTGLPHFTFGWKMFVYILFKVIRIIEFILL